MNFYMKNTGVTKTSSNAAMNKTNIAISIRSDASNNTFSKFVVPKSCLMIATESIPPASAAMKYAAISGMPCTE